ncbi:MAG: holin-associated N-acetylmuramidase [Pseudomonadota bacterium]
MLTPRAIAREIVTREGGYVNDPDDPGGATKHGVTIHTMRRLGLDLDGDGDVDVADVKRITPSMATDIYLRHYFERPSIAALPKVVQASVFDMYVNAGSHAIRILQRLVNDIGLEPHPLDVDGKLGPMTTRAAHRAAERMGELFRDAYGIARRDYYYALADRRPASRKYARRRNGGKGGWITRAEEFMAERFRYSDADHRKRVAAW